MSEKKKKILYAVMDYNGKKAHIPKLLRGVGGLRNSVSGKRHLQGCDVVEYELVEIKRFKLSELDDIYPKTNQKKKISGSDVQRY